MKKSQARTFLSACSVLLCVFFTSCAGPSVRIQNSFVPPGSFRLAQVMVLSKRDEVFQAKQILDAIVASGIASSDIQDGSVAVARIYCCGGMTDNTSSEKVNALLVYIPTGIGVKPGDFVELKAGRPPESGDGGAVNVVTRVVQRYGDAQEACWWDPKNDRLWLRVLYCSWMPGEGWVKQDGLSPAWYKPTASTRN